eukprot:TRINITY_DN27693_c1_g1_i1.p1 TRINITY_DN27693_c1_g1~~TRINITY_DN27693_c1_g1_i1.p1  ORF type:complete len:407 (-),score=15.90 TRINITY_DN27693_c1_g1_i1:811-1920(-)
MPWYGVFIVMVCKLLFMAVVFGPEAPRADSMASRLTSLATSSLQAFFLGLFLVTLCGDLARLADLKGDTWWERYLCAGSIWMTSGNFMTAVTMHGLSVAYSHAHRFPKAHDRGDPSWTTSGNDQWKFDSREQLSKAKGPTTLAMLLLNRFLYYWPAYLMLPLVGMGLAAGVGILLVVLPRLTDSLTRLAISYHAPVAEYEYTSAGLAAQEGQSEAGVGANAHRSASVEEFTSIDDIRSMYVRLCSHEPHLLVRYQSATDAMLRKQYATDLAAFQGFGTTAVGISNSMSWPLLGTVAVLAYIVGARLMVSSEVTGSSAGLEGFFRGWWSALYQTLTERQWSSYADFLEKSYGQSLTGFVGYLIDVVNRAV